MSRLLPLLVRHVVATERLAAAAQRIADSMPMARRSRDRARRPPARPPENIEDQMPVPDTDSALATQLARRMGLVVLKRKRP